MEDSAHTVDWVSKLDTKLYPVLGTDSVNVGDQIQEVNNKLNNIVPEIKRAQQEIQLRIKTAEDLIARGELDTEEGVPPKLKELYSDICSVVVDYTALLEMFTSFLANVKEMDTKIIDLKEGIEAATEPSSVDELENMKDKYLNVCQSFLEQHSIAHSECQKLINKIKQQEPPKAADKDIENTENILLQKQGEWEALTTNWDNSLKRWERLLQFDSELLSINNSIKDLTEELNTLRSQYNQSLSAAKSSSVAFQYFEKALESLEHNMDEFITSTEEAVDGADPRYAMIEEQLNSLKDKWNIFCSRVSDTRRCIDLSIQYYTLMEEIEEWFKEGTKLLVAIARKTSVAKTSEDVSELLKDIKKFLETAELDQDRRIKRISALATELFGEKEQARNVDQILIENNDMMESFVAVSKELTTLKRKFEENHIPVESSNADNAVQDESVKVQELPAALGVSNVEVVYLTDEMSSSKESDAFTTSVHSQVSQKEVEEPKCTQLAFIERLTNVTCVEGSPISLQCRLNRSSPDGLNITWFKNGVPATGDRYCNHFDNGVCKLTINKTAVNDSAKYVCCISSDAGKIETSAILSVTEADSGEKLAPPSFVVLLAGKIVKEGESCEFRCKVSGNPLPVVQWYKGDVCIDVSPDYVITYNNGDASLTIERVKPDDEAMYACTASNQLGRATSKASLVVDTQGDEEEFEFIEEDEEEEEEEVVVVEEKEVVETKVTRPQFVTQLRDVSVYAGDEIKLECDVSGAPFRSVFLLHNEKVVDAKKIEVTVHDKKVVILGKNLLPEDSGVYVLVTRNEAGEDRVSFTVTIKEQKQEEKEIKIEERKTTVTQESQRTKLAIQSPLQDVSVKEGSEAHLECVIIGFPEPEVIWYHNGKPVKESDEIQLLFRGDKCTLHIRQTCLADAGEYKVIARNSAGEVSDTCCLKINEAPEFFDASEIVSESEEKIGTTPKFVKLLTDTLVREGDDVVLECIVTGHPRPTVKWILNTEEVTPSERVLYIEGEEGKFKLLIHNASMEDKGLYTVKASNAFGEAKCFSHVIVKSLPSLNGRRSSSSDVHLQDKLELPSFAETFSDITVAEGSAVKFECIVTGKPAPKVKWYFNDEPVSGSGFLVSTSGDRQVLTIPEAKAMHHGIIACVAENDAGKTSCTANIKVLEGVTNEKLVPTFDTKMNVMESSESFEMKRSVFMQSSDSTKSPTTKTDSYISVSKEATQKIDNEEAKKVSSQYVKEHHEVDGSTISEISSHSFTSDGTNAQKQLKANATTFKSIKKPSAPKFLTPIGSAILDEGSNVAFEAVIEGHPNVDVVWSKNGNVLSSIDDKIEIQRNNSRATLVLKDVKSNDTGRYKCYASNSEGSATCTADLVVKKKVFPPVMCRRLHPHSVAEGERVSFEIEVTGIPEPTVTWYKDDKELPKVSPFYRLRDQGNSHSLIFEKVRISDSGQFKVRASNEGGESVSVASLHVFQPLPEVTDVSETTYSIEHIKGKELSPSASVEKETNINTVQRKEHEEIVSVSETVKIDQKVSIKVDRENRESAKMKYSNLTPVNVTDQNSELGHDVSSKESVSNVEHSDVKAENKKSVSSVMSTIEQFSGNTMHHYHQDQLKCNTSSVTPQYTDYETPYLEPETPPEICYVPKESVSKTKKVMAERVKELESNQRLLSPVEIPSGAVRIFPPLKSQKSTPASPSCVEEPCVRKNVDLLSKSGEDYTLLQESHHDNPGPICRPQADVDLRPLSPRPSAEGVSMEKLWTTHRQSYEECPSYRPVKFNPVSSYKTTTSEGYIDQSVPPYVCQEASSRNEYKYKTVDFLKPVTDIRPRSPQPSAEGIAMEKLWSHPVHVPTKTPRPHSSLGLSKKSSSIESTGSILQETSHQPQSMWSPPSKEMYRSSSIERDVLQSDYATLPEARVSEKFPSEKRETFFRPVKPSTASQKGIFARRVSSPQLSGTQYCSSISSKYVKPSETKYQWTPHEVGFENSLVRKTGSSTLTQSSVISQETENVLLERGPPPEIGYAQPPTDYTKHSYVESIEHDLEKDLEKGPKKCVFGGVRTVPPPPSSGTKKTDDSPAQTLPRSFKFQASTGSKFRPVKPYCGSKSSTPFTEQSSVCSDFKNVTETNKMYKNQIDIPYDESAGKQKIVSYKRQSSSPASYEYTSTFEKMESKYSSTARGVRYEHGGESNQSGFTNVSDRRYNDESGGYYNAYHSKSEKLESTNDDFRPFSSHPFKKKEFESTSDSSHQKLTNFSRQTSVGGKKQFVPPPASPSKFVKGEFRETGYESNYESRIPPVWNPASSNTSTLSYKPVRPNLMKQTSTPSSFDTYHMLPKSANISLNDQSLSTSGYTFTSTLNPYSSETTSKTSFSESIPGGFKKVDAEKRTKIISYSDRHMNGTGEENSAYLTERIMSSGDHRRSLPEIEQYKHQELHYLKQAAEAKKLQRVEEMKKHFESRSRSFEEEFTLRLGEPPEFLLSPTSKSSDVTVVEKTDMSRSVKTSSQRFIDDIVANVSSKQSELKKGGMTSTSSLYSPNSLFVNKQNYLQTYKDESKQMEQGTERNACSHGQEGESSPWYQPQHKKLPMFSTPLHDIAVMSGGTARFECIVQADPSPSVIWKKDGTILSNSELCNIYYRNGVCRLTLPKAYKYDAGVYYCVATNSVGVAETSATLTVSGERRSFIKK